MSHWSHVCTPCSEQRQNERGSFKTLKLLLFRSLTIAWVLGGSVAVARQGVTWFLLVTCLQQIFKYFCLPFGGQQLPLLVPPEVCSAVTATKLTGLWTNSTWTNLVLWNYIPWIFLGGEGEILSSFDVFPGLISNYTFFDSFPSGVPYFKCILQIHIQISLVLLIFIV